jgi:chemotaxis protein methyltransferase CheR
MTSDLQLAQALADRGKLEAARELCEAALARDRLDPEAHLLLAAICHEQGEFLAALEALRRAIYLAPDSAPAHFLLGSLLLQQGQRKRGRRSMETVVSLLSSVPRDEAVAGGGDGLTAGRLLETARMYLELPS